MTINFTTPENNDHLKPRITVVGCGGAGGNAVNNMISKQLEGVEFVVANTDAQAISHSLADRRVQLGRAITHGLGAGSRPDMGRAAAEEALEDIEQILNGSHMVFIAAGMGGGTGTGAAPVIARLAREQGMLTVGVVTKPFQFEGINRMRVADAGIEEMQQFVDTLIVIPNQNLFRIANEKTTFSDAFAMADDVLHSGVRGVTDLMVVPGLINLDFADIRSVMSEMGKAMMGTGESDGEERARLAAEAAISNPLLDDVSMKGARGVLINITGGPDMTLFEVDEAANRIGDEVDADANIIFGSALDQSLEGRIRVSVVATGIDINANTQPRPVLKVYNEQSETNFVRSNEQFPNKSAIGIQRTHTSTMPLTMGPTATALKMPEPVTHTENSQIQLENTKFEQEPVQSNIADLVEPETENAKNQESEPLEMEHIEKSGQTMQQNQTDQPFIPPLPSKPDRMPSPLIENTADPFREAEMLNAAPAPQKKKNPNIFQRMTSASRAKKEDSKTEKDISIPPVDKSRKLNPEETTDSMSTNPNKQEIQIEEHKKEVAISKKEKNIDSNNSIEEEITHPQNKEVVLSENQKDKEQPELTELKHNNHLSDNQSEEDLLEIPAFLRRQAN
ncbi:MAG: cell division protein FtsZ [Rhodospirillaceae bacterium]|nr:cell division protein FtsZ [Rhodospirillaceae bacterium]